jgi:hypothetical protein
MRHTQRVIASAFCGNLHKNLNELVSSRDAPRHAVTLAPASGASYHRNSLPTDTAVPTATIVWFPPSATPTLAVPTYTATPEMNPGIGE